VRILAHQRDYPPAAGGIGSGELSTAPEPADNGDTDEFADIPRDVLAEADAAAMEIIDRYRRQRDDERVTNDR
jgi:hypothetical protein